MPRRSGGRAAPAVSRPAPAPAQRAPVPYQQPARQPMAAAPAAAPLSQGPGLFGQMAATAGGVAIGSAVGHAVGHAFTGGGNRGEVAQAQPQQPVAQQQQGMSACDFELRQFLDCSQAHDLSLCEGFNQQLRDCRARYGL